MAKCPLARNILLASGGSISYTTPAFISKLTQKHDNLKNTAVNALKETLKKWRIRGVELTPEEVSIEVNVGTAKYVLSGRPDIFVWITGEELKWDHLMLVGEVTLMSTCKHLIFGELLFYMTSCYLSYGAKVAGLLINPKNLYLILPKVPENSARAETYFRKEGIPALLLKLFRPIDEERALEYAEEARNKKPWICSLCDLRNLCPISGEV